MKPIEFKNMACYLSNGHEELGNEILLRTIINRYYYYIFLHIRDWIIKLDGREEVREILIPTDDVDRKYSIGAHTFLLKYLKEVAIKSKNLRPYDNTLDEITLFLGNLFDNRKKADYKLDVVITNVDLEDAKELVNEIEENLEVLFDTIAQLQGMNKLPNCNRYLK